MISVEDVLLDFKAVHGDCLEEVFGNGYCYWLALILQNLYRGDIMYNPIMNHFATRIEGKLYDITGEISEIDFEDWEEFQKTEPLQSKRIIRDCVLKERYREERLC